jgi:hypothetical protein
MGQYLDNLKSRITDEYWYREKYKIKNNLASVTEAKALFNGVFSAISNQENPDDLISLTRVKKAIVEVHNGEGNEQSTNIIFTSLLTAQSLLGINGAYNSRVNKTHQSLISKANAYVSKRKLRMVPQIHHQFFDVFNLGEAATAFNITEVPELIGQIKNNAGDLVFKKLPVPTTHIGMVHYITKIARLMMGWANVVIPNAQLKDAVGYWITSTVTKALGVSGSRAARYLAASRVKQLIPIAKGPLASVTAWSKLIPYVAIAVAISMLIVVIIKKKYKDELEQMTQYVIFFGSQATGIKTVMGDFDTKKEEAYIKEVQDLLSPYKIAFALDTGIPVMGITDKGKLPKDVLLDTFNTYLELHKCETLTSMINKTGTFV